MVKETYYEILEVDKKGYEYYVCMIIQNLKTLSANTTLSRCRQEGLSALHDTIKFIKNSQPGESVAVSMNS